MSIVSPAPVYVGEESCSRQRVGDARRNQLFSSEAEAAVKPFDCYFLCLLLGLTFPALKIARLPFQFDLAALVGAYFSMFLGAVFMASFVCCDRDCRGASLWRPFWGDCGRSRFSR